MDSVANRYAVALLSLAREENKILDYILEVQSIVGLLKKQPDFLELLKSYGISNNEKKEIIKTCFENKVNQYVVNLFYVLIDNKRGNLICNVCDEFVRIGYNELNIKQGIVYSTIPLNNEQLVKMQQKVSTILKCNVTLKNQIDDSLIGGFKIQVEDYVIDESIKNKLLELKNTINLKKGENA